MAAGSPHKIGMRVLVLVGAALIAASCSTIKPRLITDKTDLEKAVGLRYYETRPFLVVRKPYPISSTHYLVQGVMANDGKSFLVTNAPDALHLPPRTELRVGKPMAPARQGSGARGGAQAQGEDANEGGTGTDAPAEGEKPGEDINTACEKGAQSPGGTKNVDCSDTSGQRLAFSSISLETDLTATAIVPINELFSIVYLPDYDREFYVESQARWGMSKLHLVRGPGGALLAYNSEVDNSAVVKPLFDAWNTLVSAATKSALVRIEPKAQGEAVDETRTVPLTPQGIPTTLRIHVVKFAVPGAYPFIKPDEIKLDKWKAANPDRMLVPTVAYQVPYDYFTVLIAEQLLDPPGSSALLSNITVGEPGDSSPEAEGSSQPPRATSCQRDHGMPPVGYSVSNAKLLFRGDPELRDSLVEVNGDEGPKGCLKTLHVKFTGDAARKEDIEARVRASFPRVELDVAPQ